MKETIEDSHIHDGHRSRMRAKLLSHGQKIFDTYELLEMLLYYVIPYKDTNPIAKRLLARFGSLDGVLDAAKDELTEVNGIGSASADFLVKMGKVGSMLGAEMHGSDELKLCDYDSVGSYLVKYLGKSSTASVAAMFFDNNMRLLDVETMYELDFESGGVKYGSFLNAAIKKRASVVITAHSHPHGPFYPTRGDIATNEALTEVLNSAGILHAEHYIICGDSYAGISSLKNFKKTVSQYPAIDVFMNSRASAMSGTDDMRIVMSRGSLDGEIMNEDVQIVVKFFEDILAPACRNHVVLAEKLLARYHSLDGVMTASVSELCDIEDENLACFVKLLAYVTSRRVTEHSGRIKNVYDHDGISEYLKALFLGVSVEVAHLLLFDAKGRFIDCVAIGEGTVNTTEVLPRKALEAAIERSASRVILAHNHPFGNTNASLDDVNLTNVMHNVFAACDINLEGHYIVAGQLCSALVVKREANN